MFTACYKALSESAWTRESAAITPFQSKLHFSAILWLGMFLPGKSGISAAHTGEQGRSAPSGSSESLWRADVSVDGGLLWEDFVTSDLLAEGFADAGPCPVAGLLLEGLADASIALLLGLSFAAGGMGLRDGAALYAVVGGGVSGACAAGIRPLRALFIRLSWALKPQEPHKALRGLKAIQDIIRPLCAV